MKYLQQDNNRLKVEISKLNFDLMEATVLADEENLKVAKLLNKMRHAKKGIKKIHQEDDESYIEIIIP